MYRFSLFGAVSPSAWSKYTDETEHRQIDGSTFGLRTQGKVKSNEDGQFELLLHLLKKTPSQATNSKTCTISPLTKAYRTYGTVS